MHAAHRISNTNNKAGSGTPSLISAIPITIPKSTPYDIFSTNPPYQIGDKFFLKF